MTEQTYFRWRKNYGGLRIAQTERLKELYQEDAGLHRALSDAFLDSEMLREVSRGNSCAWYVAASPWPMPESAWATLNGVSKRELHLSRFSIRCAAQSRSDEAPLRGVIIELAAHYGGLVIGAYAGASGYANHV